MALAPPKSATGAIACAAPISRQGRPPTRATASIAPSRTCFTAAPSCVPARVSR